MLRHRLAFDRRSLKSSSESSSNRTNCDGVKRRNNKTTEGGAKPTETHSCGLPPQRHRSLREPTQRRLAG
ncbi:hypothetical protein Trydic_g9399 [Trypoxylus dichotomus]